MEVYLFLRGLDRLLQTEHQTETFDKLIYLLSSKYCQSFPGKSLKTTNDRFVLVKVRNWVSI